MTYLWKVLARMGIGYSGVRRKFSREGQSFVTIVWRHKSTLGEVPKAQPF